MMNAISRKIDLPFSKSVYLSRCSLHSEKKLSRKDTVHKNKYEKFKQNWYDKVNNLPTIEQRLVELNIPKFHRYNCAYMPDSKIPFNGLEFAKFITRTHIEQELPSSFYSEDSSIDKICDSLQDEVKDIILMSLNNERVNIQQFFTNLNMLLVMKLQNNSPHLQSSIVNFDVRIESFWFFGHKDYLPYTDLQKHQFPDYKKHTCWIDKPIRGHCTPSLVLRTRMPMDEVVSIDSELSCGKKIEYCDYMPEDFGYKLEKKRAVILPGHFPGITNEHAHLFYHGLDAISEFKKKYGESYLNIAHEQLAINTGFSQAFSHAFFQGATPFLDPQRPVTQQTVFSNGKIWIFSLYQLNTCNFSASNGIEGNKNNILWLTKPVQLFDTIENNKVMGYNSDALKPLVKMYMKETVDVPKPEGIRFVKNHEASTEFKNEFHRHFRRMMCDVESGSYKEKDIKMWEYIYKIWNKTRPQEAKRKFFEMPWRRIPNEMRKYSDNYPTYIPKALRQNPLITFQPRINSEELMKYDHFALSRKTKYKRNDEFLKTSIGLKKKELVGDQYLLRSY